MMKFPSLLVLLSLTACSGSTIAEPAEADACEQGATRECVGAGACEGGQRCELGIWTVCDCAEESLSSQDEPSDSSPPVNLNGAGGTPSSETGSGGGANDTGAGGRPEGTGGGLLEMADPNELGAPCETQEDCLGLTACAAEFGLPACIGQCGPGEPFDGLCPESNPCFDFGGSFLCSP